jgi:hypothetical protein
VTSRDKPPPERRTPLAACAVEDIGARFQITGDRSGHLLAQLAYRDSGRVRFIDNDEITCEGLRVVLSIPEEHAAAFGILRREQSSTDLLPEDRLDRYEHGRIGSFGLNPRLARRAETPLGNVWVIPGDGWLCLSLAASLDRSSLDGGGMACARTQSAIARGLITWTGSPSGRGQMVHGLVPDTTAEVDLIAADGSMTSPRISDNVYGVDLRSALARVRVDGETVLTLRVPDDPGN